MDPVVTSRGVVPQFDKYLGIISHKMSIMYSVRNLEKTIHFSLKSRLSERFHWPEMSQIKAEISLPTNVKLIFHKNVGWQGYQWIPRFL